MGPDNTSSTKQFDITYFIFNFIKCYFASLAKLITQRVSVPVDLILAFQVFIIR